MNWVWKCEIYLFIYLPVAFLTKYFRAEQIRKNEIGAACDTYRESRRAQRIFTEKPEG
jgi:hypothetical protein